MKRLAFLAIAFLVLGATTAFAQDVRYDYAQGVNFSQYKTYRWVQIQGAEMPDQLTANRIMTAVDGQFAARGLTRTDAEDADLYVAFQTALNSEKRYTSYNTGWGYGPGWGGYWYGPRGMPTTTYGTTTTIYIGTLDLSIYDREAKQLIWRGEVSKTLDPKAKPDKIQKNINKAVKKLLKNFPPKSKR